MHHFHVKKDGFKQIKTKLIISTSVMFAAVLVIVIVIFALKSDAVNWETMPYFIVLMTGVGAFSVFIGVKRQRKLFESITVKIYEDKIVREQINTPVLTIYINDITRIVKNPNGSFTVLGKSKLNVIGIPAQMEDYQALEQVLNQVKELTIRASKTSLEKFALPLTLVPAALMIVTMVSKNDLVAVISSALLVIILSVSLAFIIRSMNIDRRTKRLAWIGIIPILAFLEITIIKIQALMHQ